MARRNSPGSIKGPIGGHRDRDRNGGRRHIPGGVDVVGGGLKDKFDRKGKHKGKNDGKGKGGKKGGKGKGKKRSPFYRQAKRMVRQETRPQLQEIQRYIQMLRKQGKNTVSQEIRLGNRTQDDLEAIFGRANEFNTEQQAKIAEVLGNAQTSLGNSYDTAGSNIDQAYAQANESANETLNRLGIQPVSARLQEDQAWLQGLNEQNRTLAAQQLAAQQGIFAQAGGMLGQAIAGEGATQMGSAATATADAIRQARADTRLAVGDLLEQRKDIKSNKGMLINQAQQLLKQQAFEQMMEQAQLQALNKQRAAQMKLDWAELNSLNKYRQGQLQQNANELALSKWKAEQDVMLRRLGLAQEAKQGGNKVTRADFMNSDVSGWKDAGTYAYYWLGRKDPKKFKLVQDVIYDMKSSWGQGLDVGVPEERQRLYSLAKARLQKEKAWSSGTDRLIRDILLIGAGEF